MDAARKRALTALALVMLVASASPAAARQMNARDEPVLMGPLQTSEPICEKATERHGTGNDSEVVAKVKLCTRLIELDPTTEDDDLRDYGILWLQSNVDARNGWCATKVDTSAHIREAGMVHNYVPVRKHKIAKKTKTTLRMVPDAEGHATENAEVSQTFILRKGAFRPIATPTERGTRVIARWKGSSATKLAFALGVEVSWGAGVGSPRMEPGLDYGFVKRGRCR